MLHAAKDELDNFRFLAEAGVPEAVRRWLSLSSVSARLHSPSSRPQVL
ncbi:hypothetical protein [Allokutzneria sp. NRRL B-24872]|nr:hypothetical protein [Allokutzneria sp. NRRL B-24872]